MSLSATERRQIENEMIFRRANEQVGADLDRLDAMHIADGNPMLIRNKDLLLDFYCECSDEKCEARISIKLSVYRKVHLDRNAFIVKINHQVNPIEKIIAAESSYYVVKKNHSTPEPDNNLNDTLIDNT